MIFNNILTICDYIFVTATTASCVHGSRTSVTRAGFPIGERIGYFFTNIVLIIWFRIHVTCPYSPTSCHHYWLYSSTVQYHYKNFNYLSIRWWLLIIIFRIQFHYSYNNIIIQSKLRHTKQYIIFELIMYLRWCCRWPTSGGFLGGWRHDEAWYVRWTARTTVEWCR